MAEVFGTTAVDPREAAERRRAALALKAQRLQQEQAEAEGIGAGLGTLAGLGASIATGGAIPPSMAMGAGSALGASIGGAAASGSPQPMVQGLAATTPILNEYEAQKKRDELWKAKLDALRGREVLVPGSLTVPSLRSMIPPPAEATPATAISPEESLSIDWDSLRLDF